MDEPAPPSKFDLLPKFKEARKAMGDKAYYAILGQLGYEHADEIAVERRADILDAMRTAYKVAKPKAKK